MVIISADLEKPFFRSWEFMVDTIGTFQPLCVQLSDFRPHSPGSLP